MREVPGFFTFILIFLILVGFGLNLFALLDVEHFHYLLVLPDTLAELPESDAIEELKRSIINVRVEQCDGNSLWSTGTGFVVKPGFVATAAHVVQAFNQCGHAILLIDYKGIQHEAQLSGYSEESDLAILEFSDSSLPALMLADSTLYEDSNEVVPVVTIGYPLVGTASSFDKAAISGEGNISRYDSSKNVFVTSGLNLNPGNSGGPIFLRKNWTVLGVAIQKVDVNVGEGLGIATPGKTLKAFFRDKTGLTLD